MPVFSWVWVQLSKFLPFAFIIDDRFAWKYFFYFVSVNIMLISYIIKHTLFALLIEHTDWNVLRTSTNDETVTS